MKKLKFSCEECGWELLLEKDDITGDETCKECGGVMLLDMEDLEELVTEDIERENLENMKENLKNKGNDETWYAIEKNIDNPYFRMEFREQFFKCGGKVPKRKTKI